MQIPAEENSIKNALNRTHSIKDEAVGLSLATHGNEFPHLVCPVQSVGNDPQARVTKSRGAVSGAQH